MFFRESKCCFCLFCIAADSLKGYLSVDAVEIVAGVVHIVTRGVSVALDGVECLVDSLKRCDLNVFDAFLLEICNEGLKRRLLLGNTSHVALLGVGEHGGDENDVGLG